MLARLGPAPLQRLLDERADEASAAGLPTDWPAFRRFCARIRKAGYCLSNGELEPHLAAPLLQADARVAGALPPVTRLQRMAVIDVPKLAALVMRAAGDIQARLTAGQP